MIPVGTLVAGLLLLWFGLQTFRRAAMQISVETRIEGNSARGAGAVCMFFALLLLVCSGWQFWVLGVAWNKHFSEQEIIAQREREAAAQQAREYSQTAHFNNGVERYFQLNFQGAEKCFTRSMDVIPSPAASLFRLKCFIEMGQYEQTVKQATQDLEQLELVEPDAALMHCYRGYAHYRLQEYRAALDDFSAALRTEDDQDPRAIEFARGFRGWIRATCPRPDCLDPILAELDADEMNPPSDAWQAFDQEAAMWARSRNYRSAQIVQEYAIKAALEASTLTEPEREMVLPHLRERLELYKSEMPYVEELPMQLFPPRASTGKWYF